MGSYYPGVADLQAQIDQLNINLINLQLFTQNMAISYVSTAPEWRDGYYHAPTGTRTALIPNEGILTFTSLVIPPATNLDRIGAEITTVGDPGSLIRLGIYEVTSDGQGVLIVDAGTIPGDVLGAAELPINVPVRSFPWGALLGIVVQGGAALRPQIRVLAPTENSSPFGRDTLLASIQNSTYVGFIAGVAGALPANTGNLSPGSSGGVVSLRKAP